MRRRLMPAHFTPGRQSTHLLQRPPRASDGRCENQEFRTRLDPLILRLDSAAEFQCKTSSKRLRPAAQPRLSSEPAVWCELPATAYRFIPRTTSITARVTSAVVALLAGHMLVARGRCGDGPPGYLFLPGVLTDGARVWTDRLVPSKRHPG